MSADHLNSPNNRDKLQQHLQTPLPPKRKTFSQLFFGFLKSKKNFVHYEKKTYLITQIFWKLLTPKKVVLCMPESPHFRTSFLNEHVHGSQTLRNFGWPHFYRNFTLLQKKIQLENISGNHLWDLRTVW